VEVTSWVYVLYGCGFVFFFYGYDCLASAFLASSIGLTTKAVFFISVLAEDG
jgi:hypothetical protein